MQRPALPAGSNESHDKELLFFLFSSTKCKTDGNCLSALRPDISMAFRAALKSPLETAHLYLKAQAAPVSPVFLHLSLFQDLPGALAAFLSRIPLPPLSYLTVGEEEKGLLNFSTKRDREKHRGLIARVPNPCYLRERRPALKGCNKVGSWTGASCRKIIKPLGAKGSR